MNTRSFFSNMFVVLLTCTVVLPLARADEAKQLTKVAFDRAVEVPGKVLPAGSYWLVLAGDDFNRDIVRIYSLDWRTLYATERTIPTEREKPAGETTFTFAQRESSKPEALLKWFYPGETSGHEFIYPRHEEKELTQDKQQIVTATPMAEGQARAGF